MAHLLYDSGLQERWHANTRKQGAGNTSFRRRDAQLRRIL